MPSRANVHVDRRLTNYAVGYGENNPSWMDRAILTVPVTDQSDKYPVYGNEAFRLSQDIIGPREDPWPEIDYEMSDDTYFCEVHGLSHFVPDLQEGKYRTDEERAAVALTMAGISLNEAYAMAAFFLNASNFATAMTAFDFTVATNDVKDYFMTEADAIHTACGMDPDTFLCARDVAQAIARNGVTRDDIKYTAQAMATGQTGEGMWRRLESQLANYLGLDAVITVPTLYNNDNEVSTTLAGIFTSGAGILYVRGRPMGNVAGAPQSTLGSPKAATRFVWTGANHLGEQVASYRVRDEKKGTGGWHVRSIKAYDHIATMGSAARLGTGLISGAET